MFCSTLYKCCGFLFLLRICPVISKREIKVFSKNSKCRYLLTKYHVVGGETGFSPRCAGVGE